MSAPCAPSPHPFSSPAHLHDTGGLPPVNLLTRQYLLAPAIGAAPGSSTGTKIKNGLKQNENTENHRSGHRFHCKLSAMSKGGFWISRISARIMNTGIYIGAMEAAL